MNRIVDQLAKLAAKVGLNDGVTTNSPYRRPEDYIAAIAEYLDEGSSGGSGGGSGSGGVVVLHMANETLDKTYAEIASAAANNQVVLCIEESGALRQLNLKKCEFNTLYQVTFTDGEDMVFVAINENGYPVRAQEET